MVSIDGQLDDDDGENRRGPLSGVVIADFSRVLAGPYCTMLLADMGAEVIKIESHGGDDTRTWMPPNRDGISTYYLSINRNKRSIALNFKDSEELSTAKEIASRADVLVENFKTGDLARFGLDYDSVRVNNPGVIYASISAFGSSPEAAHIPGYDLMVQAMSGMMSLTGDSDGPPYRAGVAVFDVITGLHAAIGILAALNHRRESGKGQKIEVNLFSSALSGLVNQSAAVTAGGVVPFRMGNAHPSLYPYEPMPASDGDLIVIAGNDVQFKNLVTVLGVPELCEDPRFRRNQERTSNRSELRPLLVARLKTKTAGEWFDLLIKAGVPCAPIYTVDKGIEFAKSLGLNPVVEVGKGSKAIPLVRNPITFSSTPVGYYYPPPKVDEHGDEIRAWLASGECP